LEKQLQEAPSELENLRELLRQRDAQLKEKDTSIGDAKAAELRLKKVEEELRERIQQQDNQIGAQKDAIAQANENTRLKAVELGNLEKKLTKISDTQNLVHAKVTIMTQELAGTCCDSNL